MFESLWFELKHRFVFCCKCSCAVCCPCRSLLAWLHVPKFRIRMNARTIILTSFFHSSNQRSMLASSEHRARCRTNRAGEFLLAALSCSALFLTRLLGSRARSAFQPGGAARLGCSTITFFCLNREKFVWVLKKIYRNLPFHHYEVVIARYSGHCSAFLPAGLLGPLARSVNYRSMLARSVCSLGYIGDSSM